MPSNFFKNPGFEHSTFHKAFLNTRVDILAKSAPGEGIKKRKQGRDSVLGKSNKLLIYHKISFGAGVKKQRRKISLLGGGKKWNFWPKYLPFLKDPDRIEQLLISKIIKVYFTIVHFTDVSHIR